MGFHGTFRVLLKLKETPSTRVSRRQKATGALLLGIHWKRGEVEVFPFPNKLNEKGMGLFHSARCSLHFDEHSAVHVTATLLFATRLRYFHFLERFS